MKAFGSVRYPRRRHAGMIAFDRAEISPPCMQVHRAAKVRHLVELDCDERASCAAECAAGRVRAFRAGGVEFKGSRV
jgi:hypothetical protein